MEETGLGDEGFFNRVGEVDDEDSFEPLGLKEALTEDDSCLCSLLVSFFSVFEKENFLANSEGLLSFVDLLLTLLLVSCDLRFSLTNEGSCNNTKHIF